MTATAECGKFLPMEKKSFLNRAFFVRLAATALSAFLLWAAFPPLDESVDCLLALVPLLLVARTSRPGTSAKWWFVGGFAFWFATLAWLPAIVKNGGPWPLVALGWTSLAAACAGYFALFGALDALLWRRAGSAPGGRRVLALTLAEPILWAGLECLRARLFSGFAWNFLGVATAGSSAFQPLTLTARLGGVYLVSALVFLVNGIVATMLERILGPTLGRDPDPRTVPVRLWRLAETACPFLLLLVLICTAAPAPRTTGAPVTTLRVALVQRSFPCVFQEKSAEDPLQVHDHLLDTAAAAKPDLVVWSESAMAEFGEVTGRTALSVADFVARKTGGAALLAGGEEVVRGTDRTREYNAAALYVPGPGHVIGQATDGAWQAPMPQTYRKNHLVPFGEYIPFDKTFTWLKRFAPTGVSLDAGEPRLLRLPLRAPGQPDILLAPLICYEDTDPRLACAAANQKADALVFITNDSWFSHSIEPVQHCRQSVFRAVETGLPVLRVGNSGVTGVIYPDGQASLLSDGDGRPLVDAPGCQMVTITIPRSASRTPYAACRDIPLLTGFGLILALLVFTTIRRKTAV